MTNDRRPPTTDKSFSRRRVLVGLGVFGLLGSLWEMGRGVLRFLAPPITQPVPPPVIAGFPAEFAPNSRTYIPAATAWLGRDEAGFYALSAVCPHLGCTIQQAAGGFECPCHGSKFTGAGDVLNGPATTSMTYLTLTLEAGQLLIDRTRPVSAETRLEV